MKVFLWISCLLIAYTSKAQHTTSALQTAFMKLQSSERYREHLFNLTQHPHLTTSKNNEKVRDYIADAMQKLDCK